MKTNDLLKTRKNTESLAGNCENKQQTGVTWHQVCSDSVLFSDLIQIWFISTFLLMLKHLLYLPLSKYLTFNLFVTISFLIQTLLSHLHIKPALVHRLYLYFQATIPFAYPADFKLKPVSPIHLTVPLHSNEIQFWFGQASWNSEKLFRILIFSIFNQVL